MDLQGGMDETGAFISEDISLIYITNFMPIINSSLKKNCLIHGWKWSTQAKIIVIPENEKNKNSFIIQRLGKKWSLINGNQSYLLSRENK